MYDSILLPVDDSEHAAAIVEHAAALAEWTEATVDVLFVADTTLDSVSHAGGTVVDALEREGESIVGGVAATLAARGVGHDTDVARGSPAPTIVEYADRHDHDLIVLPTHGRTGISRYLLGSVSEKVVRLSTVPVLTARMQPDERLTFPYETVLLPADGSPASTAAAEHGLALASVLDATVHVLSVVNDTSLGSDVRAVLSTAELETPAADAVEDVATDAADSGVPAVHTHVEQGAPAAVIREHVDTHGIDAVVMGTNGRRGVDRILLGSVAEKTVRSATVPVVTVGSES